MNDILIESVIISAQWSMWIYVGLVLPAVRECPQQIVHDTRRQKICEFYGLNVTLRKPIDMQT